MAQEVYEYYFRNYAVHFSAEAMSDAFAIIPQVRLVLCAILILSMLLSAEVMSKAFATVLSS